MDRIDAMRLFVRVVETGSFSIAAREVGVGQPAASKQVASLEESLGAQLLHRSSRGFTLTEVGREFYDASLRLLDDFEAATSLVGDGHTAARGLLRVVGPATFCRLHVIPLLPGFLARYPGINVEMLITAKPENLIEDGVDVAIHTGDLRDSTLVGRRLAETSVVTVATPEFCRRHGIPTTPNDIRAIPAVAYVAGGTTKPWRYDTSDGPVTMVPEARFRTNDAEQMRAAVLQHLGVANAPLWLFSDEIESGDVLRLLPAFERRKPITALRAGHRRQPAKVRVFIDFLETALRTNRAITGNR